MENINTPTYYQIIPFLLFLLFKLLIISPYGLLRFFLCINSMLKFDPTLYPINKEARQKKNPYRK